MPALLPSLLPFASRHRGVFPAGSCSRIPLASQSLGGVRGRGGLCLREGRAGSLGGEQESRFQLSLRRNFVAPQLTVGPQLVTVLSILKGTSLPPATQQVVSQVLPLQDYHGGRADDGCVSLTSDSVPWLPDVTYELFKSTVTLPPDWPSCQL